MYFAEGNVTMASIELWKADVYVRMLYDEVLVC